VIAAIEPNCARRRGGVSRRLQRKVKIRGIEDNAPAGAVVSRRLERDGPCTARNAEDGCYLVGSTMLTRVPRPGVLSIVIVPPCAATMLRHIDRPSPVPPLARARAVSTL
jgi:hypothetical protein